MVKWFLGLLAVLALAGLFWLVWQDGLRAKSSYLFDMPGPEAEAGYCLAVVERVREITRGQGEARLEEFVDEQISFWRGRVGNAAAQGKAALVRDAFAPGVNEGAHLHLAIQDCGLRALRFYGHRFHSMP